MVYSDPDNAAVLMFNRADAVAQVEIVIERLGKVQAMISHRQIGEAVVESFLELGLIEFPARVTFRDKINGVT